MRTPAPADAAPPVPAGGGRALAWRRMLRNRTGTAGALLLGALTAACVAAPLITGLDPTSQHVDQALAAASPEHPLGADGLGRDEAARLLYGGRVSLLLGFVAVLFGVGIGLPLGAASGYAGGTFDLIVQRVTDMVLSFPIILLALALVAILGVGLWNVIIAVGISSMPGFVRLTRASALSIREMPYVEAARALGVSPARIIRKYVVPNTLSPVIVQATLQMGNAILVAAGLGFLGLGVQTPTPEWGAMLGEARTYMFRAPALSTYPGLAIFLVVLSFNLLGDGLRDVLDPTLR